MASPDNSSYTKLVEKLHELFELDKADLDFGIYRIIGQRQDEIDDFLRNQLKSSVAEVLSSAESSQQTELAAELAKAEQSARDLGVEPDGVAKVKELREKLAASGSSQRVEYEVYEHLYRFFSRYYEEGDFISQRRVSRNARYAIPYNGEEVKLHWANADQYYIKSSENFRDYRFKLADDRSVQFKLLDADTNRDNTKGDKRFFRLIEESPLIENGSELQIQFHYSALDEKKVIDADGKEKTANQNVFNGLTLQTLFNSLPESWAEFLGALQATKANPKRTLLEKHLNDYTAKNSFDYFIHKDLGGFLRQELDFYIKNEVMFLDDIEDADSPKVESYLRSLKGIRRVAGKVIDFLAQLENFQKKLWLKKKFVVQCDYCITLDRVPDELYTEIAANEAQVAEWRLWGATDEITVVDERYIRDHQYLLVDTKFFDIDFKRKLLSSLGDLDKHLNGLLINADNFQALNFLKNRYKEQVECTYIDPPYNTDAGPIMYKNSLKSSSWLTLFTDRFILSREIMKPTANICVTIDDFEQANLQLMLEGLLGKELHLATAVIRSKPQGRPSASGFSINHEYALFFGNSHISEVGRLAREGSKLERYPEKDENGIYAWTNFRKSGGDSLRQDRPKSFYPVYVLENELRIPAGEWDGAEKKWNFESPNANETVIYPIDDSSQERVWSLSAERARQEIYDLEVRREAGALQIFRKYRPNQAGSLPDTWWADSKYSASESGTKVLQALFGMVKAFSFPKSIYATQNCLHALNGNQNSLYCDYFAGSGTTGHAVLNLNREDKGNRKYILVEQGAYFDTVLKPRIQKVIYSENWKDGKPVAAEESSDNPYNGTSHCFKYLKLESYEDVLNNLELKRDGEQQELLTQNSGVQEDYLLNYMLDVEAKGSLINVDAFTQPFDYQMHITTDSAGETRKQTVDLVETFNYLLGLRVHTQRQDTIHVACLQDKHGVWQRDQSNKAGGKAEAGEPDTYTFLTIDGTMPDDQSALVVWRVLNDIDDPDSKTRHNIALDYFLMERKRINPREGELDVIYVNGDNTLPNIRAEEEHWKVRLIEEEFQRLMFAEDN